MEFKDYSHKLDTFLQCKESLMDYIHLMITEKTLYSPPIGFARSLLHDKDDDIRPENLRLQTELDITATKMKLIEEQEEQRSLHSRTAAHRFLQTKVKFVEEIPNNRHPIRNSWAVMYLHQLTHLLPTKELIKPVDPLAWTLH